MRLSRRHFLAVPLLFGTGVIVGSRPRSASNLFPTTVPTPDLTQEADPLSGDVSPVHDPCIIREGNTAYVFCTGPGIPIRSSDDLHHWTLRGRVFDGLPQWAQDEVPGASDIWAPDISYFNGLFHLYYSVSTFGSRLSRIGLATTPTLDPDSPDYLWTDHGKVIESRPSDDFNAIDPNLIADGDGGLWLAFGSFWGGIKLRRLDGQSGKPSADNATLYDLASRSVNSRSIEGAFIIHRNAYYYLFVSFDFCCRGINSSYRVMVGRSASVTGPYHDRDGVAMLDGGGTQVTFPTRRWRGPGHNSILRDGDTDRIVYHAYDAAHGGAPVLRIDPLRWDAEGWPSIAGRES